MRAPLLGERRRQVEVRDALGTDDEQKSQPQNRVPLLLGAKRKLLRPKPCPDAASRHSA
jgi:hypothetical protein